MKNLKMKQRTKRAMMGVVMSGLLALVLGLAQPAWARVPAPEAPEPRRPAGFQPAVASQQDPVLPFKLYLASVFSSYQQVGIPVEILPEPGVQAILNQVTSDQLWNRVADLTGVNTPLIAGQPFTLATRYSRSGQPIEMATTYAYEQFQAFGLPVQYHSYQTGEETWRNVVAEQPGQTQPDDIFMIVAHLDSTIFNSKQAETLAPGADDNASGSAAVLTAADLLSDYTFGCTVRYALFTGEEQGLYGSAAYARHASSQNERIRGVLNLDMIAFNADEFPMIDLHARPENTDDLLLAELMAEVVQDYNLALSPEIFTDGMRYSDHASFWNFDFPAILAIEDDDDFNSYYHSPMDTLDKLDMDYYVEFVKAAVGTMAHLACPNPATFER